MVQVGARAEALAAERAAAPEFAQLETLQLNGRFAAFNRAFFPGKNKNAGKWANPNRAGDAVSPSRVAQVRAG